ncbi:MAG: chemotaxis protein CheW, partial [Lentisphaeraceae bacterium]|nr:chemotaxis protein CheW [Lentisphaeraceae bacterium]
NSKNITPVKQAPDHVSGVINLRGQIVTIFDLAKLFDFKQPEGNEDRTIIIVNFDGEHFGFLISEIIDIVTPGSSSIEASSVIPQNIKKEFVEKVLSVNNELYSFLSVSSLLETETV